MAKIGNGNLYLNKNWLSRNDMGCGTVNHNHTCHIFAKKFLDLILIKHLLTKY